jgi:beta-galactosidase GanA
MYANAWLAGRDTVPGDYPSGGPQPRVLDIWRAAGSALDMYAPDLYAPEFESWCTRYHRPGNPLFIPETNGGAAGAANVFYALGEQAALGFSPFGIDAINDATAELGSSYSLLTQLAPLLLEQQSKGNVHGFVLDKNHPSVEFNLGGYTLHVSLDEIFGLHAEKGFGLVVATGPDEFVGVGKGFRVLFTRRDASHAGLASVDEGRFEDGKWIAGRRLNGDENDQGGYWRFDQRQLKTEKAKVYQFD